MSKSTLDVSLTGWELLNNPAYNKGTGFTAQERKDFKLTGLLPYETNALSKQLDRAYAQYGTLDSDLSKNTFLQSLKAQNNVLFFALINAHLKEMFPVICIVCCYFQDTPTEAEAITKYSHLFRRSEGLYLSPPMQDDMEAIFLQACDGRTLDLIVVSDGEEILGIGDQGGGAIGISSAKAVIYTLGAGVDPTKTLAVALDVGTNNEELLSDDLYVGYPKKRLPTKEYDHFVDTFVQLVQKHQPQCLLHFEDFGLNNAQRLLYRYKDHFSVGTGAITLAAIWAGVSVTKSKLADQRIIVFGAGTAGLGIARQLVQAICQSADISKEEAESKFWLVDKLGLIKEALGKDKIRAEVDEGFVRKEKDWGQEQTDLLDVVAKVHPTILIGTSTKPGAFTEDVVREMSKHVKRPIIFPLSNPTKLHEVTPQDANNWSDGKALIATGSPFPPVKIPGSDKTYDIAECNNALIYPGLGLGTILSGSKSVTDSMIIAGAKRLSELAPAMSDPDKALLPPFEDAYKVNFEVALAVMEKAVEDRVSSNPDMPKTAEARRKWADANAWRPLYRDYKYVQKS